MMTFVTRPLREVEKHPSASTDSYLTFYAFSSDLSQPSNPQGASAKEVYQMISLLEKDALKQGSKSPEASVLKSTKSASQEIANWLKQERKIGEQFIKKSYFLPIPVALVAVIP